MGAVRCLSSTFDVSATQPPPGVGPRQPRLRNAGVRAVFHGHASGAFAGAMPKKTRRARGDRPPGPAIRDPRSQPTGEKRWSASLNRDN